MNKAELVRSMSRESKLSQKDCTNCLNALMEIVKSTLKSGDNVNLIGFGRFQVKNKNARKAYNSVTQSEMILPATKSPYFKPAKNLKQAIF